MGRPTFLCVGGDARQIYTSRRLADFGKVYTFKINDSSGKCRPLYSLAQPECSADVLVLPMMSEGLCVPCCGGGTISCLDLSQHLKKGAVVTGGRLTVDVIEYFSALGFEVCDYFKREELVVKNCIPTAEGALQLAMQEMGRTVFGSRTLIIGYGRVAKAAARLFQAVGADVSCTARSLSAVAEAHNSGCKAFLLSELYGMLSGFDLIINTVPAMILDEPMLEAVSKDTVIIDLASKPGGVDHEAAARLNRREIHALALPGKVAPITAGEIIAEAVCNLVTEKGIELHSR